MEKRPFSDQSSEPTEDKLKVILNDFYPYYERLKNITNSFNQNWNFSKTSGWMFKVHKSNKALFYMIPLNNEFKISLAIRDNERNFFLDDNDFKIFHKMILSAKKYREGYSLIFRVAGRDDYNNLEFFIKKLIKLRS